MTNSRIPDFVAVSSPQRCDLSYGEIRDGDRIGKGGNAIVSRCDLSESDSDSPDTIALKQPQQSPETINRDEIERFLEKGKTLRRLDNI